MITLGECGDTMEALLSFSTNRGVLREGFMKSQQFLVALLLGTLGLLPSMLQAGSIAAKSDGVQVFESASKTSAVLMTLKKDQELESGERKGLFWEVTLQGGKKAFVSVSNVTRKVEATSSSVAKAMRLENSKNREEADTASARQRTSVMGVRGLSSSTRLANAGDVRPNLRAVYEMEDRKVNRKAVESLARLVNSEVESKAKSAK